MIERISELPFFGPEEQIRRFVNQHDEDPFDSSESQRTITQKRIEEIDDTFQKQLIWSYDLAGMPDAYFWWDWCPTEENDIKWHIVRWTETQANQDRQQDRVFKFREFNGYANSEDGDEMPVEYDASEDEHTKDDSDNHPTTLDKEDLRHNIMRSYIEVSEWLGDEATKFGSHNGYVSRKMSMCWLFDSIRALINFKLNNQDRYAEEDIYPLTFDDSSEPELNGVTERFLTKGESSSCNVQCTDDGSNNTYTDEMDLTQDDGCCAKQLKVRSSRPMTHGTLKVRGNAWFYGERFWNYAHTSFIGECRFFHNARFLGQTTFDKEINGTALRTRWADLAEYKESDREYEPGTLVMFGGECEITISDGKTCHAIVTTKPGLVLNSQDKGDGKTVVGIALTGTVPVKVIGNVRKFDKLVPSYDVPGYARSRHWYDFFKKTIGIALQDSEGKGVVNCITRMNF